MKKYILLSVSAALLLLLGFFVWNTRSSAPSPKEGWLTYGNPALGFQVNYPHLYTPLVSESATGVSFGSDEGPWVYAVSVSPTEVADTQTWLDMQPKGSSSSAGAHFINHLDREPDFFLYSEYVIVDQDGNKPVYGQFIKASYVNQGKIFTIQSRNPQPSDESPMPSADFIEMVKSFRLIK